MIFEMTKKRSRRALDCGSAVRKNNYNCLTMNNTRRTNRTLLSAAVLALATLVITIDTAAVVAFTPNTGGRASLSTGPVSSPVIDSSNNKDTVAMKISPMSTKRRGGSFSSTVVDDDSTTTTFDSSSSPPPGPAASDHGVSIMTSPILNQQRMSRLGPHSAKSVVVLDDEYFHHNNNIKKNELAVQLLFNNDIVSTSLHGRTSRLVSTDIKQNPKIIRPKSRNSSSPKKSPSKRSTKTKSTSSLDTFSSSLLTRDEEREITYRIRDLRRVVRIRDEMLRESEDWSSLDSSFSNDDDDFPTEKDWAKVCDLDVLSLRRVMSEGQEARSVLVSANAGLVRNIAKRHYYVLKQMTTAGGGVGTILTLQDMIQEGNLGLMKAAERFEPERGFRFSTYATYWIRQRILQSITDSSRVIRLPVHVTDTLKKLNKARKEISAEIGRMPSDAELAHHMNMSADKLRRISDKARSVVSLESPLRMGNNHRSETDRRTIGDFIASDAPTPEEDAEHKSLQQDIRAVVNELAEREREVLVLRFGLDNGEPMSTSETAAQLGITTDRVRHVETRALNKLRNPQRNYRLKDYLGEGQYAAVEEDQQRILSTPTISKNKSSYRRSNQEKMQKRPLAHEKFWFF